MTRKDIFYLFLTALMLILSFPPFFTGLFSVAAFVPFFIFLGNRNIKKSVKGGYFVGLIWSSGTIYWIGLSTITGAIGSLIWVSFYFTLFSFIQAWLIKRLGLKALWAAPFIWITVEFLTSLGQMAFPWNSLAYTQTYFPLLIQYASITGIYGVSFWIVLLNVLFYQLLINIHNKKKVIILISSITLLFLLPLMYGMIVTNDKVDIEKTVKVSLLQGNIDPYRKWTQGFRDSNFTIYKQLSLETVKLKPDLIIWPETAATCYLRYKKYYRYFISEIVDSVKAPLLTGSVDYKWTDANKVKKYNAAFFIKPGERKLDYYHKIHLVPFSEKIPLIDEFAFLYDFLMKIDQNVGSFSSGDSYKVFHFNTSSEKLVKFSAIICFDSVFPDLVRRFVKNGAEFIVIITNDGWFGRASGPYQHARIAVLRAIENRVWVVRCANTGISEFIDPYGSVIKKTKLLTKDILTHSITISETETFYQKYGCIYIYIIFFIDILIFIYALKKRKYCI